METYLDNVNRSETLKEMRRHLKEFKRFCRFDGVTDFVKINDGVIFTSQNNKRTEYIKWIFQGISELESAEEQQIIKLKYLHGYDINMISDELSMHVVTVSKKLSSACFSLALLLHIEVQIE